MQLTWTCSSRGFQNGTRVDLTSTSPGFQMKFSLQTLTPWLITTAAVATTATVGALATKTGPWYYGLSQPRWKPPDWLFGPVWTVIYILTIAAVVLTWNAAPAGPVRRMLLFVFGFNAIVNALWSIVFFTMQRPDWALIEIIVLWLSVVAMIVVSAPYTIIAPALLAVYLCWVSFATMLNLAVVRLNGPF